MESKFFFSDTEAYCCSEVLQSISIFVLMLINVFPIQWFVYSFPGASAQKKAKVSNYFCTVNVFLLNFITVIYLFFILVLTSKLFLIFSESPFAVSKVEIIEISLENVIHLVLLIWWIGLSRKFRSLSNLSCQTLSYRVRTR